ncbi:MAG: 4Fe-4S ferredoxin [Chloroflexi bacterium]|nr:4Fe-4S ferredoxin [Chloroflexota bacterium]
MEQKLRKEARKLLEEGEVDYIIGFAPGSLKFSTTPLIAKGKEEVASLVINPFMVNNLAKFLTEMPGRVGIVAKGCDSRSIVSLIQDNQVTRENVVIIGVPCSGLIDIVKIEKLAGKDRDEIDNIALQGEKAAVIVGGQKTELFTKEVLFDNCLACEFPTPQEYDILIGEPVAATCNRELGQEKMKELEGMTPEQRWEFWKCQFGRCIMCYACRQVCPACFCERCFVEESQPQWVLPVPKWQDNLIFQIIRNIHVAGRCTDCGECERVCPVNIPLRSLTEKMYGLVKEMFNYEAGTDKNAPPLMTAYEYEEVKDLIR